MAYSHSNAADRQLPMFFGRSESTQQAARHISTMSELAVHLKLQTFTGENAHEGRILAAAQFPFEWTDLHEVRLFRSGSFAHTRISQRRTS